LPNLQKNSWKNNKQLIIRWTWQRFLYLVARYLLKNCLDKVFVKVCNVFLCCLNLIQLSMCSDGCVGGTVVWHDLISTADSFQYYRDQVVTGQTYCRSGSYTGAVEITGLCGFSLF